MAKWVNLKSAVAAVVKTNGNKDITGANMQTVLNSIINAVGNNAGFAGIATPTTNPSGIPDGPTFYIATQGGTYSYFPSDGQSTPATIQDGVISVLYNQGNGLWAVTATPMSIADGSVTTGKLATGAVTGAKIADGAVTTDKIANGAVDSAKIAESTIRWENMDQGAVDKDVLQDDAVIESKIKDGAVTEYKLGNSSVSTRSIKDGAVTTNKLYNGAVTTEKIANGSITNDKISDLAVSTQKIAPNAVTYNKIADDAVGTDKIVDEAITTGKIADEAITSEKIADDSVNEDKIQTDSIYEHHIVDHEVTKRKLGQDVIEELENKANIDGSYESMSVGMAKNVEGTSPISGIFTFRPTAGNGEVASGVARVLKIGGNATPWNQLYNSAVPTAVNNHKYFCREYNSGVERSEIVLAANLANWFTDGSVNRNVIDLTLMLGYGAEPSSVVAFETWLQNNIGLQTYYPYNEGKLLAAKLLGLRTVGFNQWDEEWEVGGYNNTTGVKKTASDYIRSVNQIKVIGGVEYYFKGKVVLYGYRNDGTFYGARISNGNWVTTGGVDFVENQSVVIPKEISYLRISINSTTYNNDICINLHYTNGRDGEYEPYVEHNYNFDTSKVYGKLNGEGNYVQVFPNGMRSAKAIFDILNIQERKAYIRTNLVNLSEISYTYAGTYFMGSLTVAGNNTVNCIVNRKYKTTSLSLLSQYDNPGLGLGYSDFYIRDTEYSTAEALKESLSDTYLCYARREPLVYTDLVYRDNGVDTPIDAMNIQVSNYGTEEQIVESPTNGEPNSCAATLDILYGVNAADFMDAANNGAFVSKASMESFLNTLGNAMNGVWSAVWNSSTGKYDFSFTPNAALQNENLNND